MRAIKFRAWDKDWKLFFYSDGRDFTQMKADRGIDLCDGRHPVGSLGVMVIGNRPIMQYTGLKDKNGREIYEGDIIEGNLFDRRLPIRGTVEYEADLAFYGLSNDAGITPLMKVAEIVVVGNIYENQEAK